MKFSCIAVSAASVLWQAVLPSATAANQANPVPSKSMPLKESPEPAKVLDAAPEVDSSLVGDRKLVATNNLRAGGISGIFEPVSSAPASGIVAEEAATTPSLDGMANPKAPRLKSALKTLLLKDSPEEGYAPATADTSRSSPLEDRLVPKRGLEYLEDTKTGFNRKLQELTCDNGVDFVDCVDGEVSGQPGTTCAAACDGACCVGINACSDFTGRVCKNGSCHGTQACYRANIGLVDNSCIGPQTGATGGNTGACFDFGLESTTTGGMRVKNSCKNDDTPCWRAARFNGRINGDIIDSCWGRWSCYGIGQDGLIDGDIVNSCKTESGSSHACYLLAGGGLGERTYDASAGGFSGGIINSCHGPNACHYMALKGTIEGVVSGSCNAPWACMGLAQIAGSDISGVVDCCNTGNSLNNAGGCYSGYYPWEEGAPAWDDSNLPEICETQVSATTTTTTTTTSTTTTTTTTTTPEPTSAPTSAPSSSPVIPPPGPFVIVPQGFSSDFTNSSLKDIETEYLIGKARDFETVLLDKDCQDQLTDIDITTTPVTTPHNVTYENLSVGLDVNTSSIAESSAWNGTTNELELCQIVRLFLPESESNGNGKMVLAEDIRQIKIGFEMTADFNITAGLAAATVLNETATTDVSSFVSAYKCSKDDPDSEDTSALAPNDELSVCVVSLAPNEVDVKELKSMTANQEDSNLAIVQGGSAFIDSLTEISFFASGVMVTTRLPITSFTFADGQSVTIQGQVEMELADGSTRKLRVLAETGIEGGEEASYDLEINLQEGDGVAADGAFAIGNSAIAAVALGKAFAFAAALVFVFAA